MAGDYLVFAGFLLPPHAGPGFRKDVARPLDAREHQRILMERSRPALVVILRTRQQPEEISDDAAGARASAGIGQALQHRPRQRHPLAKSHPGLRRSLRGVHHVSAHQYAPASTKPPLRAATIYRSASKK